MFAGVVYKPRLIQGFKSQSWLDFFTSPTSFGNN